MRNGGVVVLRVHRHASTVIASMGPVGRSPAVLHLCRTVCRAGGEKWDGTDRSGGVGEAIRPRNAAKSDPVFEFQPYM